MGQLQDKDLPQYLYWRVFDHNLPNWQNGLLSIYGYYKLEGVDDEGWPHWKKIQSLPRMSLGEQDYLLKQGVIEYFKTEE